MVNPIPGDGQQFRILVADDSQEIRELLFEVFSSIGYAVTCVKDGLEALASLQAGSYELLITDYCMPRLDGLALLGRLQVGDGCPLSILITAQGTPDLIEQARQAGAAVVLFKPFAVPDLVALVEAIQDRRPTH
ncbi:MAG TPA: response regulator [Patescibacteria group bacterium]|nr:response regulator [Patescibacteria group bacterium]